MCGCGERCAAVTTLAVAGETISLRGEQSALFPEGAHAENPPSFWGAVVRGTRIFGPRGEVLGDSVSDTLMAGLLAAKELADARPDSSDEWTLAVRSEVARAISVCAAYNSEMRTRAAQQTSSTALPSAFPRRRVAPAAPMTRAPTPTGARAASPIEEHMSRTDEMWLDVLRLHRPTELEALRRRPQGVFPIPEQVKAGLMAEFETHLQDEKHKQARVHGTMRATSRSRLQKNGCSVAQDEAHEQSRMCMKEVLARMTRAHTFEAYAQSTIGE